MEEITIETPVVTTTSLAPTRKGTRSSGISQQETFSEVSSSSAAVRKLHQHDGQWNLYKCKKPRLDDCCRQVFDNDIILQEAESVDKVSQEEDLEIKGAPAASRSIIENESLSTLISKHTVCAQCNGAVELEFPSVCIATIPTLKCLNSECSVYTIQAEIEGTSLPKTGHVRSSDYAVNCEFVAACIACGDGGTEAGRILGILDLPNYATM